MSDQKQHVEIMATIDKMIGERENSGISDKQEDIFTEIYKDVPTLPYIGWMKDNLYNNIKNFDKTIIIYNPRVMSMHNTNWLYREQLIRNAVKQNSLHVIKRFMNGEHTRYVISIWFSNDTMYSYDVDNVAKLFMDALHRPPDQFWRGDVIPIMLDDGRVDELHVYKNAYLGNPIPHGIFAKLEVK